GDWRRSRRRRRERKREPAGEEGDGKQRKKGEVGGRAARDRHRSPGRRSHAHRDEPTVWRFGTSCAKRAFDGRAIGAFCAKRAFQRLLGEWCAERSPSSVEGAALEMP